MEQPDNCPIFGCKRTRNVADKTVTALIDGQSYTYVVCDYHYDIFEKTDPSQYSLGFTYLGEPEIRFHPATPVLPTT